MNNNLIKFKEIFDKLLPDCEYNYGEMLNEVEDYFVITYNNLLTELIGNFESAQSIASMIDEGLTNEQIYGIYDSNTLEKFNYSFHTINVVNQTICSDRKEYTKTTLYLGNKVYVFENGTA